MQLYQPSAEQVQQFTRTARKVERMLKKKGGSSVDPAFALAKLREVIDSTLMFRELEKLDITIPALPRPTAEELCAEFNWIRKENGLERDISPTGEVKLQLGTVLRANEAGSITGIEFEQRLASILGQLGLQQLKWLVKHQDEHPAFMALLGKVYILATGLIVLDADGGRCVFCLYNDGERWYVSNDWLGVSFGVSGRVARDGK